MKDLLHVWMFGVVNSDELRVLRDRFGLDSRGRLSDDWDAEFGRLVVRPKEEGLVELDLWRELEADETSEYNHLRDELTWYFRLRYEREPLTVAEVDEWERRIRAVAAKAGLAVTEVQRGNAWASDQDLWADMVAAERAVRSARVEFLQHSRARRDALAAALRGPARDRMSAAYFLQWHPADVPDQLDELVDIAVGFEAPSIGARLAIAAVDARKIGPLVRQIVERRMSSADIYEQKRLVELLQSLGYDTVAAPPAETDTAPR